MPPEPGRSRRIVIVLILGIQIAAIAASPFAPRLRFLAWAPFHEPATCRIRVRVGDRDLSEKEVAGRYGLSRIHGDWQLNDIRNVLDVIEAVETTTGRRDRAEVRVDYRRNAGKLEVWRWPPAP